jgi:cytochrome c biogenesis protein CcdA
MFGESLTLGTIITAALIDSINPCTFGIFIFLLSALAVKKSKKAVWTSGLSFIAAVFISYMLMGYGLITAFNYITFKSVFYYAIGILALILGVFSLRDYVKDNAVCKTSRSIMKVINKATNAPMMFLAGILCSLLLLPCTSGPYIIVSGILAEKGFSTSLAYLVFYNLIFILPLLVILILAAKGFEGLFEKIHHEKRKTIALITAIIMISIGLLIIGYNYYTIHLAPAVCIV